MGTKNKKIKRIDLLDIPDSEKAKVIRELKQSLRQTIVEAKLWNAFLGYDNVTINGRIVFSSDSPLEGLSVQSNLGKV